MDEDGRTGGPGARNKLADGLRYHCHGTLESEPITQLLQEVAAGDQEALNRLIPLVYVELKRLAGGFLRGERPGHTLQPTALVHEAYAKLLRQDQRSYKNRAHFLSVAASLMRQILIDHARAHRAAKRGSGNAKVSLEEACACAVDRPAIMIALSDALDALERQDRAKARLIEMHYFGGLTLQESAEVSGTTLESVRHGLRVAQAFLQRELARHQEAR
jgi:RNA polymerase sigma factor (TIGR02999 family)